MSLDFSGLDARLLPHAQSFLSEWFPAGRVIGHEFCIGDIHGSEGESLKFNLVSGAFADFADRSVSGNGLIALYAATNACSMGDAFKRLSNGAGVDALPSKPKPASKSKSPAITPLPDGLTAPREVSIRSADAKTWDQYAPSNTWWYRDGIVCRVDRPDGSKEIVPHVWTEKGWRQGAMPEPRCLYRLLDLLECSKPVLVVEGEKAADAAVSLCGSYSVVTWAGGASAWRKTDWSPLDGRKVLLWPDADEPGIKAMQGIAGILAAAEIKIIDPRDVVDGWDAADAIADGWTWKTFKEWAVPRITVFTKGESDGPKEQGVDAELHGRGRAGTRAAHTQPGGTGVSVEVDHRERHGHAVSNKPSDQSPHHNPPPHPDHPAMPLDRDATDQSDGAAAQGNQQLQPLDGLPHIQIWNLLGLDYTQSGPVPNLDNVLRCLTGDPSWQRHVWFDEFLQRILTGDPPREWTDTDDTRLQAYLQRVIGIKKVSRETVTHAVVLAAHQNRRNQVKDYIRATPWDRNNRCAGFFTKVLGAPDTDYTRAASQNFWISMIARVEQPGCKVDNMVILEGGQGMGKSTVANLIGGKWFAEQHESATNPKAFAENLAGVLLTEISEMDAFSRAEVNRVKQVVSCRSDRFRVAYGRHAEDHPRQGIFFGTTNKDDWNRDETGARRFWPIRCTGRADVKYVEANRDQLFAEALYLFQQGMNWWDMPEEETKRQQAERYVEDAWQARIEKWLASSGRLSTTIQEILDESLGVETARQGQSEIKRVSTCLRMMGWENGKQERLKKASAGPNDPQFVRRWFAPGQDRFTVPLETFKSEREINAELDLNTDTTDTNDTDFR